MKPSSSSSPSTSSRNPSSSCSRRTRGHEKLLPSDVISPWIRGQTCPICLIGVEEKEDRGAAVVAGCFHAYCLDCILKWSELKRNCPLCNAKFDSWYRRTRRRYCDGFVRERLPPISVHEEVGRRARLDLNSSLLDSQRYIRRLRDELRSSNSRTRPLPWQRSFGRPGSVPTDVLAERKCQWRASIYSRRLAAVPLPSMNSQKVQRDSGWKERMLVRIEPWIRRELEAILGDPDPLVIVHVATSVFIVSLEVEPNVCTGQLGQDNLTSPLQPFLHGWTDMFWHELRCFAESSLSIETYDAVVEYKKLQ